MTEATDPRDDALTGAELDEAVGGLAEAPVIVAADALAEAPELLAADAPILVQPH